MSNYTQLGLVKQTDGENEGTWGDVLNENLIDLLDDAIGGYVEISVASGNVTLAFADGTADNNGRHATIKFTGSPGTTRTVTFPDAQVNYLIINGSDGSVICTSGSGAATVTIPTGMKDIIYVDGSDEVISMFGTPHLSSSGNFTVDATTDIILDADGGDIFFKDGGTTFGSATNTSGNLIIKSGTTTAATFSGANVTLAGTVGSGAVTSTGVVIGTTVEPNADTSASDNAAIGYTSAEGLILTGQGSTSDVTLKNDADTTVFSVPTGTNNVNFTGHILSDSGITINVANDITLDADGGQVWLSDGGTLWGSLSSEGGTDFYIAGYAQDKDIIFRGNDGGSNNNLAYFDVSDAGKLYLYGGISSIGAGEHNVALSSASSSSPTISLTNTNTDNNGAILKFSRDDGNAGAASDISGVISFYSDDAAQNNQEFARISGVVLDATSGGEEGGLDFYVAEYDGTVTKGMAMAGLSSDGNITVDISTHDGSAGGLKLGGTLVTSTAAELNILDGVTSTAAELNLIDGGTARGTDALADGDGILINDGGTMKMTNVTAVKTYMTGTAATKGFAIALAVAL